MSAPNTSTPLNPQTESRSNTSCEVVETLIKCLYLTRRRPCGTTRMTASSQIEFDNLKNVAAMSGRCDHGTATHPPAHLRPDCLAQPHSEILAGSGPSHRLSPRLVSAQRLSPSASRAETAAASAHMTVHDAGTCMVLGRAGTTRWRPRCPTCRSSSSSRRSGPTCESSDGRPPP